MNEACSPAFLNAFRQASAPQGGRLSFEQFMRLALFHPEQGYYSKPGRTRVGRTADADFYTSSSIGGSLFGELVIAASENLLRGRGLDPAKHHFIEIGAETERGILAALPHPFASNSVLRLGEALTPKGPCVVFSNELFDAQPCRHLIKAHEGWRELGVEEDGRGGLQECTLEVLREAWLPEAAPEGYVLDAPLAAGQLAEALARQAWSGLFLAFDYGTSLRALCEEFPSGTLRAYHQHKQIKNLLARPGEQDLTCHVCWDWLVEALQKGGCVEAGVESQESFLVKQAGHFIGPALAREGGGFSPRKQALIQLLHPAHMGRKFQVLRAWKTLPAG